METDTPGRGPAYRLWKRIDAELNRRSMSQAELARLANAHLQGQDVQLDSMQILRLKSTRPKSTQKRWVQVRAIAAVLGIPEDEALEMAGLVPPKPATVNDTIASIEANSDLTKSQRASLVELVETYVRLNAQARERDDHGGDRTA